MPHIIYERDYYIYCYVFANHFLPMHLVYVDMDWLYCMLTGLECMYVDWTQNKIK